MPAVQWVSKEQVPDLRISQPGSTLQVSCLHSHAGIDQQQNHRQSVPVRHLGKLSGACGACNECRHAYDKEYRYLHVDAISAHRLRKYSFVNANHSSRLTLAVVAYLHSGAIGSQDLSMRADLIKAERPVAQTTAAGKDITVNGGL